MKALEAPAPRPQARRPEAKKPSLDEQMAALNARFRVK
jgi:hypothetical protein